MTHRDTPWPTGTPCWFDIAVPDLAAGQEFYGAVMGWTFVDSGEEYGHYSIAQTGGRAAAGIGPVMAEGQVSAWTAYLATDDIEATGKLIDENGGSLLFGPMDIPGAGRMSIAHDVCGGAFGIWQANPMPGAGIVNEPGSVTWTDTRLTDVDAGKAFYTAVFGYTYEPVEGAPDDYSIFQVDGQGAGGIGGMMGSPEGVPAHWLTYFSVTDADAAIAETTARGGQLLIPAEDTPFGRIGVVRDPFGAPFGLHHTPPAA